VFAGVAAVGFGIVALARVARARRLQRQGVRGWGIVLGGSCVALVSVLVVPFLLAAKARANESAAIDDIRPLLQTEVEYSKVNGDFCDTLECVALPSRCIALYDATKWG